MDAVASKNTAKIVTEINAGADVAQTDAYGQTGLHLAAALDVIDALVPLINAGEAACGLSLPRARFLRLLFVSCFPGSDITAVTKTGNTPLHWSAANNHPRAVAVLLAYGAGPCLSIKNKVCSDSLCLFVFQIVCVFLRVCTCVSVHQESETPGDRAPRSSPELRAMVQLPDADVVLTSVKDGRMTASFLASKGMSTDLANKLIAFLRRPKTTKLTKAECVAAFGVLSKSMFRLLLLLLLLLLRCRYLIVLMCLCPAATLGRLAPSRTQATSLATRPPLVKAVGDKSASTLFAQLAEGVFLEADVHTCPLTSVVFNDRCQRVRQRPVRTDCAAPCSSHMRD